MAQAMSVGKSPQQAMAEDISELVMVRAEPFNAETPPAALRLPITPTPLHYVRSNFALPSHDGMVRLGGAVERPLTLTVEELRDMPATTMTVTLECAGNGRAAMAPLPTGEPWAGTAVGTAAWTGVPLVDLLASAAPRADAVEVAFAGADHGPYKGGPDIRFERSLPLAMALRAESDILLAYAMNGAPLPPEHGGPLRLVVPGWYGMASVKWLTRINALATPFTGQFQTRSYVYEPADGPRTPVTTQRVRAIITDPAAGLVPRGPQLVRGRAWSGTGPVTRVEVSSDSGEWREARLEPPTAEHGWQEWSCDWQPVEIGRHALRARASDAAGNTQPDRPEWNRLGYGNNAVQTVLVDVR